MKRLKELKDKSARVATEMRELHALATKEDRGFSTEETSKWDALGADFERLEADIASEEQRGSQLGRLDEVVRRHVTDANGNQLDIARPTAGNPQGTEQRGGMVNINGKQVRSIYAPRSAPQEEPADLRIAFDAMIRRGLNVLSPEHRELIEGRHVADEQRAQSIGTPSGGGYTVPQDFASGIEVALKAFSGVRQAATVIPTADGRALPWPTVNDTTISGALITENTADSEQDVTFGTLTLNAYTFTSRLVRVSIELLQDSAIDVSALLGRLLGDRLGRGTAAYYATGTGSSQPQGIVTASTLGKTAASATAFTYDEMLDLKHAVDPAYRINSRWMMNDAILKAVKKLKDLDGRPIWQPNIAQVVPATIDGDGYVIEQGMSSALTTGQKIMVYGDLSKFHIRDVLGYQLVVLRELYAANRQVGFNMFMRTDSKLVDAGTNPVKYLILA